MFSHFLRKAFPFVWRGPHADADVVRAGGLVWHVLPDALPLLGDGGPDLPRWIADGLTATVKHGPHRTVYRVSLPGGTVYAKHCRVSGFRAWAREVLRPAKARLEFENALALRQRGVAAVVPVGWGCRRPGVPGESLLLTRGRDEAVPFQEFLEAVLPTLPPAVRRRTAVELGRFMAAMHDAGVAHPDPHPGNLIVEVTETGVPAFSLIDVHAVRVGPPLGWAARRANLVLYNRWFQLRATRTDRCRFWRAYVYARRDLASVRTTGPGEVERGTLASNLAFWAGRASRCLGTNRYFRTVKAGPVRGVAVRDLPADVVNGLLADPDAAFARPGVRLLKDSRTSTVAELTLTTADGPRVLIWKRFRIRSGSEPWKNLFRRSPALRSWATGHTLRDRWLPTPRPVLLLHRTRRGLPAEGYLLTEKVPDALGLPEAVAALAPLPALERTRIVRLWVEPIARLVRTLHERGGSHRDLKASNVMMRGAATDPASAEPVFIDLVGVRVGRPPALKQRVKELARLNASFLRIPAVSRADRLRFLRVYLAAHLRGRKGWKDLWTAVARATAAKVVKNARNGRPLA